MYQTLIAIAGAALLAGSMPASAGFLGEAGDLEHARANARAGGPISEYDAELLERWGCTSGARSALCEQREERQRRPYQKHRRHKHRNY